MTRRTAQTNIGAGVIDLGVGHPSLEMLPLEQLRAAAAHRFNSHDPSFLQYGLEQGDTFFREQLAAFLTGQLRAPVAADDLMISGGVSQALDLICATFTQPGDTVIVEAPTYFLALNIFRDHGLKVLSVPLTPTGLDMAALAELARQHAPKLVYTIPTHQNPTGVTLAETGRAELVRLAEEYGFMVVADEVYHLLTFEGKAPTSLSAYASSAQILSLGSFSKILAPGTRLGWVHARPERLSAMLQNGALASGGGFTPLGSALVRSVLELGLLEPYIASLNATFAQRAAALCAALAPLRSSGLEFTAPRGGYFVWGRLPKTDTAALLEVAASQGVRFQPGTRFSPQHLPSTSLRLCFAYYPPAELEEGARRLGEALSGPLGSA